MIEYLYQVRESIKDRCEWSFADRSQIYQPLPTLLRAGQLQLSWIVLFCNYNIILCNFIKTIDIITLNQKHKIYI